MLPSYLDAIAALGARPEDVEDVFTGVDFGVFVDHVEQGCIYANAEVFRMFEMSWEEFRGFGWARAVLPSDMETLREAIERYEREKSTIRVQYRIKVPDGSLRTISVFGRAVLDANGDQLGSVMIGREITAERAEEDRLVRAQKLEVIGSLAGRIAHDFNNVLTPIMCSADLLETEDLSDEGRELLEAITHGVEHAASITRQLLGLAKHQVEGRRVCVLDAEIEVMETLLRQLLGEGVTLDLMLGAAGLEVGIPGHEVGQIVLNLAVNGRDAMQGQGALQIETRRVDGDVVLTVRDEGVGIPKEVQERMFEPFFTTKSPDRGTGLGLTTVADLVKRAGGRIEIDSVPGEGAQILIRLPCIGEIEAAPEGPSDVDAEIDPLRVLVVDDNSALRQTLAYVLALRRHEVETSATFGRAEQLIADRDFDVVVTDVLLPDGLGTSLVEGLRADRPELPVIYISGFPGSAHAAIDLETPRTAFLQKPFHPNELARKLAEVVR